MHEDDLLEILTKYRNGEIEAAAVIKKIKLAPYDDLGFAKIDHHRELRQGFPEVIFCKGKTNGQILQIAENLFAKGSHVLATKIAKPAYEVLKKNFPGCEYFAPAGLAFIKNGEIKKMSCNVLVITGGTADIPVAEEAAVTAEKFGTQVERIYDVGVAGLHRLLDNHSRLLEADIVIAAAGMDGALPGVAAGLCEAPVIAIPTSIGYGASFDGLAALLTMLNSCSSGISVVNIDNGFGAGYLAAVIARQIEKRTKKG